MLQRLEDRVVFSGTSMADVLTTQASHEYCTQADVSSLAIEDSAAQASDWNSGASRLGSGFGPAANANASFPAGPAVDQLFGASGPYTDPLITAEGEKAMVAPFWRKVGDQPTLAPDWYANRGPVTHDVYYDSSLTSAQNGAALQKVLSSLSAGDHVVIHGGTYSINSFFMMKASGTAAKPITIEGAPGERVVITRSDTSQNVVNIDASQYVILQGLTIQGGSTGLKLYGVDNFMLYNTEIWNTANNAIAANSNNTSYLYFVDNNLHDTGGHGEGLYLGAMDGSVITHHSYVVGNYIHDLTGADVNQGDGIEIKDGSYAVTIKYNFIENTNYPGIIVYRTGRGMTDRNLIEENVVLHSNDVGIQATADAIIRNNLVVSRNAFLSKPLYTSNPQNLTVVNNTFVSDGYAVRTYNWDATSTLANNAIYSSSQRYIATGTGTATNVGNVLVSDLTTAFVNLTLDGSGLDATPASGSPLVGAASPQYLPVLDLNGAKRVTEADAGAVDYLINQTSAINHFDFGTDTSPVAAGETRVTPASKYSSAVGYGWLSTVGARDRGTPDAEKRDFNYVAAGAMTFGSNVANGTYQVTIVVGDAYYATGTVDLSLEGKKVDTFSTAAGQFLTKTYVVNVTDGQLSLTLNRVGSTGFAVINSLSIDAASPTSAGIVVSPTSGLKTGESGETASFTVVLSSSPTSDVVIDVSSSDTSEGTVAASRLTFTAANWNQPQTVTVTGIDDTLVDGDVPYAIVMAAQSADAAYDGLKAADVSITNLDNDTKVVTPTGSSYDFGTSTSPLAAGSTRVTPTDKYSSASGYGWLSGAITARDRGGADDIQRDFNFVSSGSMTFAKDLAAGTYQVTLVIGDQNYATGGTAVFLEGQQVDTVSTGVGQFVTKTFFVTVNDGQLTLTLSKVGNSAAVINGLTIEQVA